MAYRNKVYVCFDADTDMKYYRTLQMWDGNKNFEFELNNAHELNNLRNGSNEETVKRKLKERMLNSKLVIVLIGEDTKNLYKFVRWEIEEALKLDLPIIAVNLNNKRILDEKLCPPILRDRKALHISFNEKILNLAMKEWITGYVAAKLETFLWYYYSEEIYKELGL